MPNLIDKPQLQATAQVAKSYVDAQDTANVNTIINALQQSGGGGGLLDPQLSVDTGAHVTFLGSGTCDSVYIGVSKGGYLFYLTSDGTYRNDWVIQDVVI